MTKVTMLEPVAVVVSDYALFWAGSGPIAPLCERTGAKVGSQLITTDQAEAYAAAKVREALQEVLLVCAREQRRLGPYNDLTAWIKELAIDKCATAIRALIPK